MKNWPATHVEMRSIDSLIPYIRNARTHSDHQVSLIASSIQEFGWTIPVLISEDNTLIAGHGRVLAAKKLGITEVPTMVAKGWTEDQRRAYTLTDNKLTIVGKWDDELLKIELGELKASDFNLELTGFDTKELDLLLKTSNDLESKEDNSEETMNRADELQQKWAVSEGDLFQCGDHRILCADCSNQESMQRLLKGEKPKLLMTDPPYGVKMDKGFSGSSGFNGKGNQIARRTYADEWDSERPSLEVFKYIMSLTSDSIIWGGNFFADLLPMSTHWLVWDKHQTMPTYGDCELAWTSFNRKSVKKYDVEYNGLIGREKERFHPTQKPLKLFSQVIVDYTELGYSVLDVYAGSGTTLIACEDTDRIARIVEMQPSYVAVALERWSQQTGQEPMKL